MYFRNECINKVIIINYNIRYPNVSTRTSSRTVKARRSDFLEIVLNYSIGPFVFRDVRVGLVFFLFNEIQREETKPQPNTNRTIGSVVGPLSLLVVVTAISSGIYCIQNVN